MRKGYRAMILAIANQKGGIGKTTTAQAFLELLREGGSKALGIDLDTQGNLSAFMGRAGNKAKVAQALEGKIKPLDAIEGDFIAGDYLTMQAAKGATPKQVAALIEEASGGYPFCVVDTPVTIDTLTLGALLACDALIIPTTADGGALMGINALANAIDAAKRANKRLKAVYVLFVKFDKRKILDRQLKEQYEARSPYKTLTTAIRQSNPIREAQTMLEPLMSAKASNGMKDYRSALSEILEGLKDA